MFAISEPILDIHNLLRQCFSQLTVVRPQVADVAAGEYAGDIGCENINILTDQLIRQLIGAFDAAGG